MNLLHDNMQKLEAALKAAYRQKEATPDQIGGQWQMNVMRDIRRLTPFSRTADSMLLFNRFVWRFAATACMITLLLSAYIGVTGFDPTEELINFLLGNPVEFSIVQVFGVY